MDLQGKVAIVTGGASGIGLATVEAYVKKGAKVVIADYNEEGGKQAESDVSGDVTFIQTDVSKEEAVKNLIKKTVEKYGQLDIIVNNAGIGAQGPTHELSTEDYNKVVEINQNGLFYGAKHAIPEMLKQKGGVIINTASILGSVGQAETFAYNATKGAVNLMTRSLAVEYADRGIRVNAVAPGYVDSGMVNKEALGDFYDTLVGQHPIGRLGTADEIAHAIVFLTENDFTTGATLLVDGGYTAK